MNYRAWFTQIWPFHSGRAAALSGYAALKLHPHTLADIALRNNVYAEAPAGSDIELAIAEGRRRCALEIIKLANMDHAHLWAAIEKKPTERGQS